MHRLAKKSDCSSTRRVSWVLAALAAILITSSPAHAVEAMTEEDPSTPCAVLANFQGDVQVLDPSRTHLIPTYKKTGIPCGGWVSSNKGWAQIIHRDGYQIHLGSHTFVEIPENNYDGKYSGDHVVLYRGQVFARIGDGQREFRVITANGRARTARGAMLVLFNHEDQETQMIALERSGTLENRFEVSRKVVVKAGEASSLNFKLQRVVPATPRAVASATLKPKLMELRVGEKIKMHAVANSNKRVERKFASVLVEPDDDETERDPDVHTVTDAAAPSERQVDQVYDEQVIREDDAHLKHRVKHEKKRGLAASAEAEPKGSYDRHHKDKVDADLHQSWVKKMVAGSQVGERILFPDKFYGRPAKVKVHVESSGVDDAEKKRLIEELSQIREE